MAVAIGVDLGSSSARAVAIDRSGAVLATASAPYPHAEHWPAGRADPTAWLDAVVRTVHDVRMQHPDAAFPEAISVGGQSPAVVADGAHLAVTVRHPAGATLAPAAQHAAHAAVLAKEGGAFPSQGYDWIARQLGADAVQSRWVDDEAIADFGDVRRTGEAIGETSGSHGLPAGIRLAAGGQDAFLAFWAGGLTRPGLAMDPGGRTGGFVATVETGQLATGAFRIASANRDISIVGGPVNAHGLAIEWLRELTGRSVDWLLSAAEEVPAGVGGAVFVPYLEGERAPRWNRDLRAGLTGVQSDTGPAELTRAVLEGTAFGLRHILDGIRAEGVFPEAVVCTGSPARSRLWCTIKASVLRLPVLVPVVSDLAALGSAYSAAVAAGWWPAPGQTSDPQAWPVPAMSVIEPEPSAAYDEAYQRFLQLGDFTEQAALSA